MDGNITVCGCGCGFPIRPGMRVYLVKGVPYTLGCVTGPTLVTPEGPDLADPLERAGHYTS